MILECVVMQPRGRTRSDSRVYAPGKLTVSGVAAPPPVTSSCAQLICSGLGSIPALYACLDDEAHEELGTGVLSCGRQCCLGRRVVSVTGSLGSGTRGLTDALDAEQVLARQIGRAHV